MSSYNDNKNIASDVESETENLLAKSDNNNQDSKITKLVFENDVKTGFEPNFEKSYLKLVVKAKSASFLNEDQLKINQNVHDNISKIASSILFEWKKIPIVFPPSLTNLESNDDAKLSLFTLPVNDDLDEIASDTSGKRKKLSKTQLESIKKQGNFEVESKNFPGMNHRWQLARWLQKGYENSNISLYSDLSNALRLIIITAKNRFSSTRFSILAGLKTWKSSILNLIDLLVGLPHMKVVPYELSLNEEFQKFLVSDLTVDPDSHENLEYMCKCICSAKNDDFETNLELEKWKKINYIETRKRLPYLYRTSNNLLIDLRLLNKDIFEEVEQIFEEHILPNTPSEKDALNKLSIEKISLFKDQGLSEHEIIERAQKILLQEYINFLYKKIAENSKLEKLSPGISKILIDHCKSVLIVEEVTNSLKNELTNHISEYESQLRKNYKIKSRVIEWINECLNERRKKFTEDNKFTIHLKSIEECKKQNLNQAAYFIERELNFITEHQTKLTKEFEKIKEPVKNVSFYRMIWFPKNYKIIENEQKTSNGIEKYYTLEKSVVYKNTTEYPFWRWTNFFIRTWVYFCNVFFIFGLVVPFVSKFSFRALFSLKPYYPEKTVDRKTGKLVTDTNHKYLTFASRFLSIWQYVGKSRKRFESIPDKGLIGKSVQRVFNVIWNYFFVGFIGSVGLTLIFPTLCVVLSLSSIILCLLSPVWYPLLSLLSHLCHVFIFDWDYPYSNYKIWRFFRIFNIIIFKMLICGILQPVLAILSAIVLCPAGALAISIFAITRKISRKTWDGFIFYIVLKHQARIPSSDTFVARRTAGPGLASNYFYQISTEQGLACLETYIELKVLDAYISYIEKKLNEPLELYRKFFSNLFEPYSYTLNESNNMNNQTSRVYEDLRWNVSKYLKIFRGEYDRRQKILSKRQLSYNDLSKIRLTEQELKILLVGSSQIIKKYYTEYILKYENKSTKDLFQENMLLEDDWISFSGSVLEKIFSIGIMTPLEKTDLYFSLKVDHLNLAKYTEMISTSNLRDDLESYFVNYNPKKNNLSFDMPQLAIQTFNPVHYHLNYSEIQNKSQLKVELPSNLAIVAVIVYNNQKDDKHQPFEFKNFDSILDSFKKLKSLDKLKN